MESAATILRQHGHDVELSIDPSFVEKYCAENASYVVLIFTIDTLRTLPTQKIFYKGIDQTYKIEIAFDDYRKIVHVIASHRDDPNKKIARICSSDQYAIPYAVWKSNDIFTTHSYLMPPRHTFDIVIPIEQLIYRDVRLPVADLPSAEK